MLGLPVVLLLKEDQLQSHEALGAINELICTGQLPHTIFSTMAITQVPSLLPHPREFWSLGFEFSLLFNFSFFFACVNR